MSSSLVPSLSPDPLVSISHPKMLFIGWIRLERSHVHNSHLLSGPQFPTDSMRVLELKSLKIRPSSDIFAFSHQVCVCVCV